MNAKHNGVKWTEERGRRPIINLSNKILYSGQFKEEKIKTFQKKNSMRSQLADYSKAKVSEVILKRSKLGCVTILRIWLQSSLLAPNNSQPVL